MFMAQMMVMDGFMVYAYPQTHRVVYVKYGQLFTCQSYLNKVIRRKQEVMIAVPSRGEEQ